MMKKIISLLCLLVFLPAGAAYAADGDDTETPGGESETTPSNVISENTAYTTALTVDRNMVVDTYDETNNNPADLYINIAAGEALTLRTTSDITVNNTLSINSGRTLYIGPNPDGTGPAYGLTFGNINVLGTLNATGVGDFVVENNAAINGTVDVSAQTIKLKGETTVGDGATLTLNAASTGASTLGISVNGFTTAGNSTTNLTAATISVSGNIKNPTGTVNINAPTNITMTGDIVNGGTMNITGGDAFINGDIENSNNMTLTLGSLTVRNVELSGNGKFSAVVSGTTTVINSFDVSNMGASGTFNLETGKLDSDDFSNQSTAAALNSDLKSFTLAVKENNANNVGLHFDSIVNGNNNNAANMTLAAQKINVSGNITNNGNTLNIKDYTPSATGTYSVNDVSAQEIRNNAGTMTIVANNALGATNVVNAGGNMVLSGLGSLDITQDVGVSGGTALLSSDEVNGKITVGGTANNSGGDLTFKSGELTIAGGITHAAADAGTTTLRANGMMTVGAIDIASGKLNVNALSEGGVGNVKISKGGLSVTGGQVNFGDALNSVASDGLIDIAGNLLGGASAADGAGNVNVASHNFTLSSTTSDIEIAKNVLLTKRNTVDDGYHIALSAANMTVGGDVYAGGSGMILTFGDTDQTQILTVSGSAGVANGAKMVIKSNVANFGNLSDKFAYGDVAAETAGSIDAYGSTITVGAGGMDLAGGIDFGTNNASGLNILSESEYFNIVADPDASVMNVGNGISVADGKRLNLTNLKELNVVGAVTTNGTLSVNGVAGNAIFDGDINNSGSFDVTAAGDITTADITSSSNVNLTALSGDIETGAIKQTDGTSEYVAKSGTLKSSAVDVAGGELAATAKSVSVESDVSVSSGSLNFAAANDITIGGNLTVSSDEVATNKTVAKIGSSDLTNPKTTLNIGNTMTVKGNSRLVLGGISKITVGDAIVVDNGGVGQGSTVPMDDDAYMWLDMTGIKSISLHARSFLVGKDFSASMGSGTYTFDDNINIGGALSVDGSGTVVDMTAKQITVDGNVTNSGTLSLSAGDDLATTGYIISMGDVTNDGTLSLMATAPQMTDDVVMLLGRLENKGSLVVDSDSGTVRVGDFRNTSTGTVELTGRGLSSDAGFQTNGILHQGTSASGVAGDVSILSNDYTISTTGVAGPFASRGIKQDSGKLTVNTSLANIQGDVIGSDITFVATNPVNDNADWLRANITGNVSGGTSFIGLGSLQVGGNYMFSDTSRINAAIQSKDDIANSALLPNYWATVALDGDKLGTITNDAGKTAMALITVDGQFISNTQMTYGDADQGVALPNASVGIVLHDMVDQGSAIWLVHAEDADNTGVALKELGDKLRNLNVMFCNADGSKCFSYYKNTETYNNASADLPAYLSVRDTDDDGKNDSLYVVFDPRFGGPVEVFKIQPIVGDTDPHSDNEYTSAGALDNLIVGKLHESGFHNRTPIEAIPVIFDGTNMQDLMNELYDRMERFLVDRDGAGLTRFSRLVTPREIENVVGSIALNEHTNFRDLEDHMMNEFIWNRNRRLKKAWLDFDFGMFAQDMSDNKTVDGNRFSIAGGFDWQHNSKTIFGLTARASHMSMDNPDSFELGYLPNQLVDGRVDTSVDDTNIGIGGYMLRTLNPKMRLYGNLFADMHILSVSRDMNYMSHIDGDGSAFAITTEWGLMHDWLNQYIVGNLYARAGYNTGFSVTEKAAGADYMKLESDGYVLLAPGYTLIAQKRIYPSAWVQIRPYVSAGIEYDVLGMPDNVQYKFAFADGYTDYNINIDPLWANFGGGFEVLSVRGYQVGLDYRYQYNTDIRMHNIKVSGSYRF